MRELLILAVILITLCSYSQDLPPRTEERLEEIAGSREDAIQLDDEILQQLEIFRRVPLHLNAASREEFQQLGLLTDLQIDHILSYRKLLGQLISIYELQSIPYMDLVTIRKILPYVITGSAIGAGRDIKSRLNGEHAVLLRLSRVLEKQQGYMLDSGNRYLGDPNRIQVRYRYQFKNSLYFGCTAEKDAGEPLLKSKQQAGFDFYSFHLFARNLGVISSLAVGDYTINLGQGLIQWHGAAFGKSGEVIAIKRQAAQIAPYRSAGEFYFYRGTAATIKKGRFHLTAFLSRRKLGANVDDSLEQFSSLASSGYHRTPAEISNRNRITCVSAGGALHYRARNLSLGMNSVGHRFSEVFQKRDRPYNFFAPQGLSWFNSSLDYSYTYRNLHFFGELALDKRGAFAIVNGLMASLDPRADLSLLYRQASTAYQSIYPNAFTESSQPGGEKGLYMGLSVRPSHRLSVNVFADFFSFEWIRYRVSAPSTGFEYLIRLVYQPDKKTEISLRYKNEQNPQDGSFALAIPAPLLQSRKALRLQLGSQLSPSWILKSRVEFLYFNKKRNGEEEGFLFYIEAARKLSDRFKANCRFQFFQTGGFNSRIYAYESDVMYSFSLSPFSGNGLRYYLNVSGEFGKKITGWVRTGQSFFRDGKGIGSGLEWMSGKRKTDIELQIQMKF